jgi:hypothetical protein
VGINNAEDPEEDAGTRWGAVFEGATLLSLDRTECR